MPWQSLLWLAGALPWASAQQFSLVNPGELCSDYYLPNVASESDCFSTAKNTVGLSGKPTLTLNGAGLTGCLFNVDADLVMYGTSAQTVRLNSWQYICIGVGTTTVTATVTTSTQTTTTETVTTVAPEQAYSLVNLNENCASYQIEDVTSSAECFSRAAPYVSLGALTTIQLDGLGFTGCVFNPSSNFVLYGVTPGVSGIASPFYRYICRGIATTTTTTSTTSTVTTTTLTTTSSTTSTVTETTSTTTVSTSTATTETTTTSTGTTTTLTFTTTTRTFTTATQTTATATTSTYTGSSSSSTKTSTFTNTATGTATTTSATATTTTVTATTSTITTTEGAGFVGDDPLTIYGGVAKQFWMPDGELVPLLVTQEFTLLGAAFSRGEEQWIDRLVLARPGDNGTVARVSVREGIEGFRAGEVPGDHFATLNVSLDWMESGSLERIPGLDSYAPQWGKVVFAFSRVPDFYIGEAQVEMVVVEGSTARIVIMAVPGAVPEGQPPSHAARFAHLDFVLHLKQEGRATCSGLLPALWWGEEVAEEALPQLPAP